MRLPPGVLALGLRGVPQVFSNWGGGGLCFLIRGKHGVTGGFVFNQKNPLNLFLQTTTASGSRGHRLRTRRSCQGALSPVRGLSLLGGHGSWLTRKPNTCTL